MKKISILFVLFAARLLALEMIANIREPVQTEFGLYQPVLVEITPDAAPFDPGANLEKVVNLDQLKLSPEAFELLKRNHFVVAPPSFQHGWGDARGFNEMFDIYNYAREHNIPIFVTGDALLHSFHLCFDKILKTIEEKRLMSDLNDLLDALMATTVKQLEQATEASVQTAATTNLNFLIVAKKLLDSTWVEPINGGPYLQELELIRQAAGAQQSPIFGYAEDYTQYIPRGHYTRSDSLKSYFRTMMWLGRMTYSCEKVNSSTSREATRAALLLTQALASSRVNDRPAMDVWESIYGPTVFFVGKSDDINFYPYNDFAADVYGKSYSILGPDIFADETKLTAFLERTKELEPAAITYPGQPLKGFRLMGQRFIPDSWILDELVMLKTAGRSMPTGLDVMIVLGSKTARSHISPDDQANESYQTNLGRLIDLFAAYPDSVWAQNAYWNWLYSLMPLLAPKGPGYPWFMQTPAWADRELFAALASWAELRHDTILYAKQSGSETSMPAPAIEQQGYVEPNPHLFARLAALSQFMITGLQSKELLFPSFSTSLEKMSELSLHLKEIAEKELTNRPLSSDDYKTIFNIGKTLYEIVTFAPPDWEVEGPNPEEYEDNLEPMPIIADVHTDANSGLVLEEGVGYPYSVYVICNIAGRPTLTLGAGFSYHEFTWPMNDRLTDEKWREMLDTGQAPPPPAWTGSFLAPEAEPANPDYYVWGKPGEIVMDVSLEESYIVGDTIVFIIKTNNPWDSSIPVASATFADGSVVDQIELTSLSSQQGAWAGMILTTGRAAGPVHIDIRAGTGDLVIAYRATTNLKAATKVSSYRPEKVTDFRLYQNYPNPFNPVTSISFDIPKAEEVKLSVYNVNGQLVKNLVASELARGSYTFYWNGEDRYGNPMSSGIYYYKLSAGDFVETKRMLLLR